MIPSAEASASGLTELQFIEWLSEVALECKALTTKKTFGHSLTRSPSRMGKPGGSLRGKAEHGDEMGSGSTGVDSSARKNAAKAVVLLQWMEVSRGMQSKKTGDIPPFRLSACVVSSKP